LVHVPSISVPAGLTSQGLPVGITLLGPSFSDATMIRLAYGYEQATGHRIPPATTPGLPGEP
jgi:amidase